MKYCLSFYIYLFSKRIKICKRSEINSINNNQENYNSGKVSQLIETVLIYLVYHFLLYSNVNRFTGNQFLVI